MDESGKDGPENEGSVAVNSADATLQRAAEELESVKKTIAALDTLEVRWKDVHRRFGEALAISLSSAFGGEPPNTLTQEEKEAVFGRRPTVKELCKRLKAGSYKDIIVMAGAGISVAAGIPDFRSPGSGLYDSLDLKRYGIPSPQAIFDIEFFRKNPEPFFKVRKELFLGDKKYQPTPAHHFIRLLAEKKILLRCYTQNIDSLEKKAGVPEELLVQAHGSYERATCTNTACRRQFLMTDSKVESAVMAGEVPRCDSCSEGVVKPNIVFFGEDLPERFKTLLEGDFAKCDLLIVMGTSLHVQPFCNLIHRVRPITPRLLINKTRVGTFTLDCEGGYRDVAMLDDCDSAVAELCRLCNWTKDLNSLVQTKKAGANASKSRERSPNNGATAKTREKKAFLTSSPAGSTRQLPVSSSKAGPKHSTPKTESPHTHAQNPTSSKAGPKHSTPKTESPHTHAQNPMSSKAAAKHSTPKTESPHTHAQNPMSSKAGPKQSNPKAVSHHKCPKSL